MIWEKLLFYYWVRIIQINSTSQTLCSDITFNYYLLLWFFKISSSSCPPVMTNTRGQLIGWCLRRSTAPRWRSSAGPDWACSRTPSSVRTPSLIQTYQVSRRAQVPTPRKTPERRWTLVPRLTLFFQLCFVNETIDSCSQWDAFADWLNDFTWADVL